MRSSGPLRCAVVALIAWAAVLVAPDTAAEDVDLPEGLQAELLAKVAAYDRNFAARAGDRAHVLILTKPGDADSARTAAHIQTALSGQETIGGLPHDEALVSWSDGPSLAAAVRARHAAIVYVTPGFADDVDALRGALDGVDVLSVTGVADYVPKGIVLGFDVVSGKPKLLVNLGQARRQNVAFKAEILRMMRVYE